MRRSLSILGLSLLAAAASTACASDPEPVQNSNTSSGGGGSAGGGGSGNSGGGGVVAGGTGGSGVTISAEEAACDDWGQAYCSTLEGCGKLATLIFGSPELCEEREKISCMFDFASPDSGKTAEWLGACAPAYKSAGCDALKRTPTACVVPAGQRRDRSACVDSGQCESGYCDQEAGAGVCGQCESLGTEGASCGGMSGLCKQGLVCADGKCAVGAALGAYCEPGITCGYGLVCNGLVMSCEGYSGQGERCGQYDPPCDFSKGLECHNGSTTCEVRAVSEGLDKPCGYNGSTGDTVYCPGNLRCSTNSFSTGRCEPTPADGELCQATNDWCLPPAQCVAGECTLPSEFQCN